ncbi:hypothetical protein HaLaN_18485 [Haematococcus lacustris]|uniref:Uncharacterized protein n=1 Tax=Haematococcus lacustris TaxID=44745 RepID=A0A699ZEU1_HAELA|nr:hypothetical protein HaLaN_18485 [Haematococcus lacustris]
MSKRSKAPVLTHSPSPPGPGPGHRNADREDGLGNISGSDTAAQQLLKRGIQSARSAGRYAPWNSSLAAREAKQQAALRTSIGSRQSAARAIDLPSLPKASDA